MLTTGTYAGNKRLTRRLTLITNKRIRATTGVMSASQRDMLRVRIHAVAEEIMKTAAMRITKTAERLYIIARVKLAIESHCVPRS
jgi:hypothetical protein